jgi:hypothetical protein
MDKFLGILSGLQQVPVVEGKGTGKVQVKLKGKYLSVKGWFKNLSSPLVASHFHNDSVGLNVLPIEFELSPTLSEDGKSGTWNEKVPTHKKLTEKEKEQLLTGNYYINIHTQDHLFTGEIRGQLLPYEKCGSQYICNLYSDVDQGVGNLQTTEIGTVIATLNGNKFTLSGAFSHLSSLFVSMHVVSENEKIFDLTVQTDVPAASGTLTRKDNSFLLSEVHDISKFSIVIRTVSEQISAPLVRLLP